MLLGDITFQRKTFAKTDDVIRQLKKSSEVVDRKRSEEVNRALLSLIQEEEEPCFLLSAVLDFIEKIDQERIIGHYIFTSFELWLNLKSGLSFEENLKIRGKIVGKRVDRSNYQLYFPIGMGKVYEGTHFVAAHRSPDLDTTIASFWGWMDAFAARVGDSLHIWNVPGGPPTSQIEMQWIFKDLFGDAVLTHLPKTRATLSLTGNDLMKWEGLHIRTLSDPLSSTEHDRHPTPTILVDEEGYYLTDWRTFDVEEVRRVIFLVNVCLSWFESHVHLQLISLFTNKELHFDELDSLLKSFFSMQLKDCEPTKEFTKKQKKEIEMFLSIVLKLNEGLETSLKALSQALADFASLSLDEWDELLKEGKTLFDRDGKLMDDRSHVFRFLQSFLHSLHRILTQIRLRLEKLDVALITKQQMFEHDPTFVSVRADVEEIRQKMGSYLSLTVAYPDQGKMYPVGFVTAKSLRKKILGTVSLRDFCNREEIGIPDYLDVISVIDHHKSVLQTMAPPFALIADVQSSNTLVAKQAFILNDRYSLGGMEQPDIEEQIESLQESQDPHSHRLLRSLLAKKSLMLQDTDAFIHPDREYIEYLHFLYGIIDDTDLLTKVSVEDVECVAELLNRMKTLALKKQVEIISLDAMPRNADFAKKAAKKILRNEDMYSLYKKVYAFREKEVGEQIVLASKGKDSDFFADTKVQNGCCRVGQTKIFPKNVASFTKHAENIRSVWIQKAEEIQKAKSEIDLHLHMVSTIVSAEEVYQNKVGQYTHQDEMWIWAADQDVGIEHLKRFLTAFQVSPGVRNNELSAECEGPKAEEYRALFEESFPGIETTIRKGDHSFAVIRYRAGSLNSRKAMISPFLPTL